MEIPFFHQKNFRCAGNRGRYLERLRMISERRDSENKGISRRDYMEKIGNVRDGGRKEQKGKISF